MNWLGELAGKTLAIGVGLVAIFFMPLYLIGWLIANPLWVVGLIVAAIIIKIIMIPVNEAAEKAMAKEHEKRNAQMRAYLLQEHRKTTFNNPSWAAWAANKPHVIAQEREFEKNFYGVTRKG